MVSNRSFFILQLLSQHGKDTACSRDGDAPLLNILGGRQRLKSQTLTLNDPKNRSRNNANTHQTQLYKEPRLLYSTSRSFKKGNPRKIKGGLKISLKGLSVHFSPYEGKKERWNWSVDTCINKIFQEEKWGRENGLFGKSGYKERERAHTPPIPPAARSSSAVRNVLAYHRTNRRMRSFRLGCVASETTLVRHILSF